MNQDLKNIWRLTLEYAKPHARLLLLNFLLLMLATAAQAVGISLLIPILQSIEKNENSNFFIVFAQRLFTALHIPYGFTNLALFFAAMIFTQFVIVAYQQHIERKLSATVTESLMNRAFGNLMDVSLSYYYRVKPGDIVSTNYTSAFNSGSFYEYGMKTVKAALFSGAYVVMGCLISLKLTVFVCTLAAVSYFFIIPRFNRIFVTSAQEKETIDAIHSFLYEKINGIRILKAFGREGTHREEFGRLSRSLKEMLIRIMDIKLAVSFLFEPLIFGLIILTMLLAVNVFQMTLSSLIALLFVFVRLTPQVKAMNSNILQINELMPHLIKINELIRKDENDYLPVGDRAVSSLERGIELKGVSFRYPRADPWALKDVDLVIPRHKTTAFVGGSGGGKSTLIDLILRHHRPTRGTILVDDVDLMALAAADWHRLVAVVDQDPFLFNTTILENIRYGLPEASDEEVFEAARTANAHDFIVGLTQGYRTVVGNRGITLSGGQKQRVALARALVKKPQVLVLDEATSALDSESEKSIQASIRKFHGQKTVLIVAHRLSTVVHADNIVFLEDGMIREMGRHEDLIRGEGRYRDFYNLQLVQSR